MEIRACGGGYLDLSDAYDGSCASLRATLYRSAGNATSGLSYNQASGDAAAIYGHSSASGRFLFSVLWEW